jgi:hypothetical protein
MAKPIGEGKIPASAGHRTQVFQPVGNYFIGGSYNVFNLNLVSSE